jgi:hypothetical protein
MFSPIDPAKHFLDSIKVPIPSTAKSFHDALLNLNVKGQDIVYLRGPGFSTQDEAFYISRYLKQG